MCRLRRTPLPKPHYVWHILSSLKMNGVKVIAFGNQKYGVMKQNKISFIKLDVF